VFGFGSSATSTNDTVLGAHASATKTNDTVIGEGASATANNAVALGVGSIADQINTVSVGSVGNERRITNVAAAVNGTDAVNLTQATSLASTLIVGVQNTANTALSTANNALATANNALADSNAQVTALAGSNGSGAMSSGDASALLAANAHADAGDAGTLASANAHADAGNATTLASANSYTDVHVNALQDDLTAFQSTVNDEFRVQDKKIDQIGAMGAAMSHMAMNAGGLDGSNRVGFGGGFQGGQSAFAIGFQHAFPGKHFSVSIGGAVSNGQSNVGVGGGFSW
jgi:hypothetical protein